MTEHKKPLHIKTIAEFHQLRGYPKPEHPLVSVIKFEDMEIHAGGEPEKVVRDFYSIAFKKMVNGKMKYGQQQYDFDEGVMFFVAPGQVFSVEVNETLKHSGWGLLLHPDFLWNTALATKIKQYEYFSYSVNEALYLSEKEETMITRIMQNIKQEYSANIDKYSQDVIIAQIELLLIYCERFYQRQFITRKISNHKLLHRLETYLDSYFSSGDLAIKGLPTVQNIAENLNVSAGYLSSMLKALTGQSTQQHIHDKLIEKAKEQLSTTSLSISEIAYGLGFEHSQSFSKIFKTKTSLSPLEFRNSFN
jgi:AraC-like DNA-binding protein